MSDDPYRGSRLTLLTLTLIGTLLLIALTLIWLLW